MKKILPVIIAIIMIGGGAFYGGMKYAESKSPRCVGQGDFENFRNLSPEERDQRMQELGANIGGFRGGVGGRGGNTFVSGEIIAKDDKSITVKVSDTRLPEGQGGSKIIFFSETTDIVKTVQGVAGDFALGEEIVVNGNQNEDGSVTAESIQIRPRLAE